MGQGYGVGTVPGVGGVGEAGAVLVDQVEGREKTDRHGSRKLNDPDKSLTLQRKLPYS